MTHRQWNTRIRQSLAQVKRRPVRAVQSLDALASLVHLETRKHVGDWHLEQTLEVLSIVHSHLDHHHQSADIMLQLAQRHEQQLTYYRRAFVSACATAALQCASAGDRTRAVRALRRAAPAAAGLRPGEKLFRKAQQVVAAMPRGRLSVPGRGPSV